MTTKRTETVRTPNDGQLLAVVGDIYRFLATGEDTDGKYAMWEAIVPPVIAMENRRESTAT